ncbi:FecR family protein [Sphingobacterium chuzhouense]|uniref:DUF4974 domain-containing protein n=1 Tax=Sphingobacterium chuzhouense TaxID=1742264 RepID=A0ABR7XY01_9SPHI|nr:FecR domain-containing protein [Sphingobacterium chuzhouense]MBD1423921.1 DUF4974 domain-containing protein [Sphingobacterium chuzhouense]
MTEQEIRLLAIKFLKGETTKEEEALLHAWYDQKDQDKEVVITTDEDSVNVKKRLYSHIQKQIQKRKSFVISKHAIGYAASVAVVLSFLAFFLYPRKPAETIHYTQLLKDDVGPGRNNAVLRLGSEMEVDLDKVGIGSSTEANGLIVNKDEDGLLSLVISDKASRKAQHKINTLQTPKGGQYKVELPDGTKVWLNASSTLKFPSIFEETIREIELEGEAYFEVAHVADRTSKNIPFVVNGKNQKVEVLGTHFNVNSYTDESVIKTTLLEGSVRVVAGATGQQLLLKPGQQSRLQNGNIYAESVDTELDVAWKNGDFIFNNENLKSVMRKLERWYDVEVEYKGDFDDLRFSGAVSRSKNISEVLKIMALTGKVKFNIEGRRIIVMT